MRRVRLISIALSLSLLVSACSLRPLRQAAGTLSPASHSPAPGEVTITFVCRDYQRSQYSALAQAFHESHPSINVALVSVDEVLAHEANVVSSDDVFTVAAAADTFVDSAHIVADAPQDAVLDLTDLAKGDKDFSENDFYSGPLTLFRKHGKLWGLPLRANTFVIFYNPKLFDAAGVPHPKVGWSWDDFLAAAKRLTIREGDQVKQWGYVDSWAFYTLPMLAYQKAGPLLDETQDPPLPRLDQPGVAEAVKWYADLILVHGVMPNPATMDEAELQQLPYNEYPAMWIGGSYELQSFQARCNAGVAPLPEAGKPASTFSAWGYFVSAGTTHPQEAWRWIEWLSRQGSISPLQEMPARKSVAKATRYWESLGEEATAVYQHALEQAWDPGFAALLYRGALLPALKGEPLDASLAVTQAEAVKRLAEAAAVAQRAPTVASVATPAAKPTAALTIRFRVDPDADLSAWRALADRFQREHPDIALEIETLTSLDLAQQAGEADCFVAPTYLLQLNGTSGILSLDSLVEQANPSLDPYYPSLLASAKVEGKLWALPLEADATFLYYNLALFDAAGSPYPSTAWTPQQLIERAIALSDIRAANPTYGFYLPYGAPVDAPNYLAWLGGKAFDAECRPTFDDPVMAAALAQYAALISKATPPSPEPLAEVFFDGVRGMSGNVYPTPISSGQVAMWVERYRSSLDMLPLTYTPGVAPLPAGTQPLSGISPSGLFISAQAPNPEACWAWIAFVSTQPEAVSLLPVRRDMIRDPTWRKRAGEDAAEAWLTILERGEALPSSSLTNATSRATYWLHGALADVLAGSSPTSALAAAQKKALAYAACVAAHGQQVSEETLRACAREADPEVRMGP